MDSGDNVVTKRPEAKRGRFGLPEEIAGAAFILAPGDTSVVTGQAIAVDGGPQVTTMAGWS